MDRDRLAKLLSLSQSDNDAEAISAIRKANSMLKKEGLTWQNVLGSVPSSPQRRPPETRGFGFDDIMKDWMRTMEEAARNMEQKAQPQAQAPDPAHVRVKKMIEQCMAKNYSTAKMMTILEKIKQGKPLAAMDEQYISAIHSVVFR